MKLVIQLCFILLSITLSAQAVGDIKGQVTDQGLHNEPLMMASITVKGNSSSTLTNLHGNFEISDVVPGNYILTVSFSGYDDKDIPIEVKPGEVTRINTSIAAKTLDFDIAAMLSENVADDQKPISKEAQNALE